MSELRINNITDRAGSSGPIIAGVSTVTSTSHMVMPSGPTEMRGGRGRGAFGGGRDNPTYYADMNFVEIATTGNGQDFGDMDAAKNGILGGTASSTRGIVAGGYVGSPGAVVSTIIYYTSSSAGGANDFGELTAANNQPAGASNNRLAIIAGEYPSYNQRSLQYITIATTGDATLFGDLVDTDIGSGGISSPTRGIIHGIDRNPATLKMTQFFEIATKGNAEEFGELVNNYKAQAGASSSTRGLSMAGYIDSSNQANTIEFCTIATRGNFQDFGDLTTARHSASGTSNSTRAICIGGATGSSGSNTNVIDSVTIASTGNASDFGDMTYASGGSRSLFANSDSHGGIGD